MRSTLVRSIAVLAMAGLIGGAFAANVGAAKAPLTKGKIKKISNAIGGQEAEGTEHDLTSANLDSGASVVGSLTLPKGNYVINASYAVTRYNAGVVVTCRLQSGADRTSATEFDTSGTGQDTGALTLVHSGAGTAELRCSDFATATGQASVFNVSLNAIEVPKLTQVTV